MAELTERVREQIGRHNRDLLFPAIVKVVSGVGLIFLNSFFLWLVSWFIISSWVQTGHNARWALVVVGVYQLVAFISAWRRETPLEDSIRSGGPSIGREIITGATIAAAGGISFPHGRADTLAGFASLLIGGPAALFDAWHDVRSRLPTGQAQVAAAAEVLRQSARGVATTSVEAKAFIVVQRLGLVKVVRKGNSQVFEIVATQKGAEMLSSAAAG